MNHKWQVASKKQLKKEKSDVVQKTPEAKMISKLRMRKRIEAGKRALIQAADELVEMGYLTTWIDENGKRRRALTEKGRKEAKKLQEQKKK